MSIRTSIWLVILWPASVFGAPITDGHPFSMLSLTDASGGFNWVVDHWQQTLYTPSTYLLRKRDANEPACAYVRKFVSSPPIAFDGITKTGKGKACYTWSDIGENDTLGTICEESWSQDSAKPPALYRLKCFTLDYADIDLSFSGPNLSF